MKLFFVNRYVKVSTEVIVGRVLHLRFTKIMRNTLHRGPNVVKHPQPI